MKISIKISFAIITIVYAIFSLITVVYIWNRSDNKYTLRALEQAKTAATGFQSDDLLMLQLDESDIDNREYQKIKSNLQKIASYNKDISVAYILMEKDNEIYLVASSEPIDLENYTLPGKINNKSAMDKYLSVYRKEAFTTKPTTDSYGTWVSACVPITDFDSEEVIALLAVDYPVKLWNAYAISRTAICLIELICIYLIFVIVYIVIIKNKQLRHEKNKLAEVNKKLEEQEILFRTIFEQSPIGIGISFGKDYSEMVKCAQVNPAFQRILGRTKEEFVAAGWQNITHPDDLQENIDLFEKFVNGIISEYTFKKRYIRPDGSIVWVKMTVTPLKMDEESPSSLCIVEDITDQVNVEKCLQESEKSKAVLLSNLPGMAYRCKFDRDWTMLFVSDGCYSLTGYKPENLINNRQVTYNELVEPQYREFLWEKWLEAYKNHSVFREEYGLITASGELKWVFEQGIVIYDENDEAEAIEGLVIDITRQKEREDEIRYLTYHDVMTGIYNRRYYDEQKIALDNEEHMPLSVIIGDINGLKLINDTLGHEMGDQLIITISGILRRCLRKNDVLSRTGGDEFSILLPNTTNKEVKQVVRKISENCEKHKMGELYHTNISLGHATKDNMDRELSSVIKEAEENMYKHKLLQSKSLHSAIISSMKATLYEKSQETEEHAQRLVELSVAIGRKMQLSDEQLNELELFSALHDIGKIGISDTILNKPGKLTDDEWIEMKKHSEIGYRIAMSSPDLVPIAEYILYHHEHWDGKGYPQGLKGDEIPLLSRILAVADAYDAMTQDRAYRKAMTKEEAITEIKRNSGTQFDPEIARIFIDEILNEL